MKILLSVLRIFFILFLFWLTSSCRRCPHEVKVALRQMSKANRVKFEKVFDHYRSPDDSLKLKACYFLMANMNGRGYYDGKQIRDYDVIFDILANKPPDYRENLPWYSDELNILFDSLANIYGHLDFRNFYFVKDEDAFTEESFINYIEEAFQAWENPWSGNAVSFTDFCNYVLPYRNFNEPIEPWREIFTEKFRWIHDSMANSLDIIEIAQLLNRDSELKYSEGFRNYIVSISPSMLLKAKYGTCADNSNYKAIIMRTFGIPVAIDYLPQYGTDHNQHYWNSVMDQNGNFVSFEEALNDINASVAYKYTIAKVYRKIPTKNPAITKMLQEEEGIVPQAFKDPRFIDVTNQYVATTDVKIRLNNIPKQEKYVYVAVFNDAGWTPIHYSTIDLKGYASFENLGREVVYLPVYYSESGIIPAAIPFLVRRKGYIRYLDPGDNSQAVTLTRKYHFYPRKQNWLTCLQAGKFEGANLSDFSDAVVIAEVKKTPGEHFVELISSTNKSFKYLRFVFSPDELKLIYDGDGASIAEIEFYDASGNCIKGKSISSPGRKYNSYTGDLAFDGDPLTFFEDARPDAKEKFVGLELEAPALVSRICFLPRNDMNSIQPGNEYELYYWGQNQFNSLGRKTATDTLIFYDNVPEGSLLLLHNLTGGKEERIFTWENGKQVWR